MKKKIFVFLSMGLLFFTKNNELKAQVVMPQRVDKFIVLDSALFIITYEVEVINDPTKKLDKQKDIQILQIGKHISKSYSKLLNEADSANNEAIKKGAQTAPIFQGTVPPVEIFKNYPSNRLTVSYRIFFGGPIYLYVEDKINLEWKILADRKKVLFYSCQKAITTFRGRTYEAWFTSDIPISEGPNKFGGLPGLILQIQSEDGQYNFSCIAIQQNKKKVPIKFWNWDYESTTREKLNTLLKRIHEEPVNFVESIGGKINFRNKTNSNAKNIRFPFNPLELE